MNALTDLGERLSSHVWNNEVKKSSRRRVRLQSYKRRGAEGAAVSQTCVEILEKFAVISPRRYKVFVLRFFYKAVFVLMFY